jgi:hypothetical protein
MGRALASSNAFALTKGTNPRNANAEKHKGQDQENN